MPPKASRSPGRAKSPGRVRSPGRSKSPGRSPKAQRSKNGSPSPRGGSQAAAAVGDDGSANPPPFIVTFPPRSALDTLLIIFYLPLLGLCAVLRAIFWTLGIPLMIRNVRVNETVKKGLLGCLVQRGAHRFPHSHGRPFAKHLAGVPALISHWRQPSDLVVAALFHSAYSTEMFPWGLYPFRKRTSVRSLIGSQAEHAVFLYCTVSQVSLYREARALSAIPPSGLPVVNCQTGERALLPQRLAARVLILLSADIMEQDPFFDMHLACSLLRLAAPHLDPPPLLASALDDAGFWDLGEGEHRALASRARALLRAGEGADLEALEAVWRKAPWLYEVGVEVCRRGEGGEGGEREVRMWAEAWGTAWSRLGTPSEEVARVGGLLGGG